MRKRLTPWLFLAPICILLIVFLLFPIIFSFYISLTDWAGGTQDSSPVFVGFQNFINLFKEDSRIGHYFLIALKNTFLWLVLFTTIPVALGLFIAVMINSNVKFENFYKAGFYFPMILSFIVLGLIWRWMLNLDGMINSMLGAIGLGDLAKNWIGDPKTALLSVIVAASWRHIAYCMIIFLAGLRNVPVSLVEAAKIDGASKFQEFFKIILPMLRPATVVIVATSIISSFKTFDIVFAMTKGGPFGTSNVLGSLMYTEGFWNLNLGNASAISVIMFVLVAIFSIPYVANMVKKSEEDF